MLTAFFIFLVFWTISLSSEVYNYNHHNVTRSTLSGIAEYRSALTLDWLDAEDNRQRDLVAVFETEISPPTRVMGTECIAYAKPASGKVARLMLELLKNLEGDDGNLITELIQSLIRAKLLVETSMLDAEPDLDALVKTPGVMAGEPHATFPRILAMVWMVACDPNTVKKQGWCPINKVTKYLSISKPADVASHMRSLDAILARARFIMEEFIQHVTPLNVYEGTVNFGKKPVQRPTPTPTRTTLRYPFKVTRTSLADIGNTEMFSDLTEQDEEESTSKRVGNMFARIKVQEDNTNINMRKLSDYENEYPSLCTDLDMEPDVSEERWMFRNALPAMQRDQPCSQLRPGSRDIVRRFYAILPYFDKDHSNTAFLHKFRATVYGMSEGDDLLDKEAAFYASVLTPLAFLQQYRDVWCLLERFHRAIRLYQISHPTEKRSALKLLQNLRPVNAKIRSFISELPGPIPVLRTTSFHVDNDDDELHDKKDIRYLKELIKNLG